MNQNGRLRIGLALSGGVARGPAHIGVLKVLLAAGIPIDYVAGTSAGSIIGAAYCAGLPMSQVEHLATTAGWKTIARPTTPRRGLLSFDKMTPWFESVVGIPDLDIRDLAIPLAIVTTDLETGEPVVLDKGPLAKAVQASCSVPGVVVPMNWNGRLLCDGGISNNLPVDAVRSLGANFVIAVDLFAPEYKPELGPLGAGIVAIENLVRTAGGGVCTADCLISPDIAGHSFFRFSESKKYIKLGEEAAHRALPDIQAAINGNL